MNNLDNLDKLKERQIRIADIIKTHEYILRSLEVKNQKLLDQIDKLDKKDKVTFSLNDQQRKVVEGIKNNSIIIACPGSGKTHTLIAKVANLVLNHNINSKSIVLITFTKKAAQEMTDRLKKYLGTKTLLHTGTIHGLAYRTLQQYDKINYTILGETDSNKQLKHYIDSCTSELDDDIRTLLHKEIVRIHELYTAWYPISLKQLLERIKLELYLKPIQKALKLYQDFKSNRNYLDFNDIMHQFLDFLKSPRSDDFKKNINYILFDEYQDINSIQDEILLYMNNKCNNLTVVGDDAQSIYAFRGSQVKFIIDFENRNKDKDISVFHLEKNYRSPPEIIKMCNQIISNNNSQLKKNMIANKPARGIVPKIIGFEDTDDEVIYIVKQIKNNLDKGIKLRNQAILSRKNRQLDNFELHLIRNKISYVKSKGIGLLDRAHVKDFLSFFIILVNPLSVIHWKRIIMMTPKIGNQTVLKIVSKNKNCLKTIIDPKDLDMRIIRLLEPLRNLVKKITSDKVKLKDICEKIANYLKPIIRNNMKIGEKTSYEDKIEDLYTLTTYIIGYDTIAEFLEDIHFSVEVNEQKKFTEDDDYLMLTTIHGSKGLEWEYVYITGCSSDIIPSYHADLFIRELENVEEERRLFYVACSRAKHHLEITLSYDYHFAGNSIYVSPFINELNKDTYTAFNLRFAKRLHEGNITHIVKNYVLSEGFYKVHQYLKTIPVTRKSLYIPVINKSIYRNRAEMVYGTFIDNLIAKMIHNEFHKEMSDFSVPVYDRFNLKRDKSYYQYIDPKCYWKDILKDVYSVSKKKAWCKLKSDQFIKIITSKDQLGLYEKIYQNIIKLVKKSLKENVEDHEIITHYNLTYGKYLGEADLVVDDTLFEIKTSKEPIATTIHVLQTIMYRYLLSKKGIRIKNIILFNPLMGDYYELKIVPGWKHTYRIFDEVR